MSKTKCLFIINKKKYIRNTYITIHNGKYYGGLFGHWYEIIGWDYDNNHEFILVFG